MRVLFLTLYPATMPSSRLRVYQYIPFLKDHGIQADVLPAVAEPWFSRFYYSPLRWMNALYCVVEVLRAYGRVARAGRYDAVLVQKGITSSSFAGMEKRLLQCAKRVFFDFDDDVVAQTILSFRNPNLQSLQDKEQNQKLVRSAETVIAGSEHLRQSVLSLNKNTVVLPTPVDTVRFSPSPNTKKSTQTEVVIGWIGQEAGLGYLESLAEVFNRLAQRYTFRVKVISRLSKGKTFVLPGVKTQFVEWTYDSEVTECREFDIGVMPVPQTSWGAGKCGLKLLQYMALAIPGVATDVGANREIVAEGVDAFLADSPEAWEQKLASLIESPALRERVGLAARQKAETRYSLKVLAPKLAALLKGIPGAESGAFRDSEFSTLRRDI